MDLSSPYLYTPSALSLLGFNLVPLLGALFLGWSQAEILLLYWSESAIVGFYTILKMALATPGTKDVQTTPETTKDKENFSWTRKLPFISFFIIHFGGFMLGHLVFLLGLFIPDVGDPITAFTTVLPAFGGLLLSHGLSFLLNYVWNKEYQKADIGDLFQSPYLRIVVMHVAILFGAFIQMPLLILVLGKTAIDLKAHVEERERFSTL